MDRCKFRLKGHREITYTHAMRVICAPDSFKESLTSIEAAEAMAAGVRRIAKHARIDCCPVGDGGEGTLAALLAATAGELVPAEASGPFGEDIDTEFGLFDNGTTAFIESARCIGLGLVPDTRRDPATTTTFGVGELILQAIDTGAKKIIVGIGGSATCDGGCGMAQAIGYRFFDRSDDPITEPLSGGMLESVGRIEDRYRNTALEEVEIVAACDVRNPLLGSQGAARVFAPQKGADDQQVKTLERGLTNIASLVETTLGIDITTLTYGGAAGGLGAGLAAFAGAGLESGIELVLDAVDFHERVRGCEICLTGKGRLDRQSVEGKACIGVAMAAMAKNVPSVALVGSIGDGADLCLETGLTAYREFGAGLSLQEAVGNAASLLCDAAAAEAQKLR